MPSFGDPRGLGQRAMESALVASIYESRLWRRNPIVGAFMGISFARELDCIARAAHIDDARRVLDLACGPGIYTRPFSRLLRDGRVVGLDISRPMLAYAGQKARAGGFSNLDLVRGSALALPFANAGFDVVNCCGALHLFPDVPQALVEIHRVLTVGGRFSTAVIRAADTPIGRRIARRRLRLVGVHSFTRRELGSRLAAAGFGALEVLHEHGMWMIGVATRL